MAATPYFKVVLKLTTDNRQPILCMGRLDQTGFYVAVLAKGAVRVSLPMRYRTQSLGFR
jgi:MOSC domain-containing protein YiiM